MLKPTLSAANDRQFQNSDGRSTVIIVTFRIIIFIYYYHPLLFSPVKVRLFTKSVIKLFNETRVSLINV